MNKIIITNMLPLSSIKSTLEQPNSIVEIQNDIDLQGDTYTIEQDTILYFKGGSLNNGILKGHIHLHTINTHIFKDSLQFGQNTIIHAPFLLPEWFGAKGDYDPISNTGTDDTTAIERTIRVAEQLSIKTIKFSAANYYTATGIHIKHGNIWLQGSGALLRETAHNLSLYPESNTSTIYCPNNDDAACIICDSTTQDPIHISDIQLVCNTKSIKESTHVATGIMFSSEHEGPTWPVIIERCFFGFFNHAFYINSPSIRYCLNFLHITHCAFRENIYCIGAANDTHGERQGPWAFEFTNNRCHYNCVTVQINVAMGICRIEGNNCECSYHLNNKDEQYVIDVQLQQDAHAIITHNHFEQNKTNTGLVKVYGYNGTKNEAVVLHNNTNGMEIPDDPHDKINDDNHEFNYSYKEHNIAHFTNVLIETDMNFRATNCFIKGNLPNNKAAILDTQDNTFAFIRQDAILPMPSSLPTVHLIRQANYNNKMFINTSNGKRCYSHIYHNSNSFTGFHTLVSRYFEPNNKPYINVEIPFYKKTSHHRPCSFYFYAYINSNPILYFLKHEGLVNLSEGGEFRLRIQSKLEGIEGHNSIYVVLSLYAGNNFLNAYDELYVGSRAIAFSDSPLDLKCSLNTQFDMIITGETTDNYMLLAGDTFVSGKYSVTCLEDGNRLDDCSFQFQNNSNIVTASRPIPIGSIWENTSSNAKFRITRLNCDCISDYLNVPYYYEIMGSTTQFTNGIYQSHEPVLLGHGSGNIVDRNTAMANRLCKGSTYYDVTTNKYYILKDSGWVETQ